MRNVNRNDHWIVEYYSPYEDCAPEFCTVGFITKKDAMIFCKENGISYKNIKHR